jgi:hypothetical protein
MKHFLDIESKVWDSAKDGTIKEFVPPDTDVPVTVFLQWFEGGWNRIYEVRIGSINAGSENRILAEEVFGAESQPSGWTVANISEFEPSFGKGTLKPKSPFYSDIPIEFLERVPSIVSALQRDIEGTRQAVQLLRDEYKLLTGAGSLNRFWQEAEDNERAIVAFKLKELLYQSGVHAYRNVAFELLSFKNKNGELISLPTFNRLSTKGERLVRQKNTPKGVKK